MEEKEMFRNEEFECGFCKLHFWTDNWFNTQKTDKGKVTKRLQTGCPSCHKSLSKKKVKKK